jgi:ring-1,2-phenylacetyl-CoA epoxidase subunit PaaB
MSKDWPLWEVFVRARGGLSHRHVGSVHAPDAAMALRHARDTYTRRMEGVSLWVAKSADIKVYRHPTFYDIPNVVKHI